MDTYVPRYRRVYLVDDHDIVRRGLRDLLVNANDIDVVGDSASVREAVPEILRLEADVMLLDLHLQDGSGIEVCRAVRSINPSVSGLLLTGAGDDEAQAAAVLAGAAASLVKLARNTDIVGAIRGLRDGASLMDVASKERATRLLGSVIDALTPPVSEHERRILDQVVAGRTDSQIADALATDGVELDADIEGLVERVAQELLGRGSASGERGSGKHRRPD